MKIYTVHRPIRRGGAALVAVVVLVGLFLIGRGRENGSQVLSAVQEPSAYLESLGWEVEDCISCESFVLADTVGEDYLALQREGGFDISGYVGCTLVRYTYPVTNYPTGEENVLADLLVYEGRVVGGDLRSADLDGFLTALTSRTG